mmetsp:Transcript_10017/g.16251  ORF Transcript_10017/g.16251 Transcript_10017/m.16251 type:complete len:85 (+) Transcript_10017:1329-1583(+)
MSDSDDITFIANWRGPRPQQVKICFAFLAIDLQTNQVGSHATPAAITIFGPSLIAYVLEYLAHAEHKMAFEARTLISSCKAVLQ